jgi:hypothetical protein
MLSGKLIFSKMGDHSEKYCMRENVDEMLNFLCASVPDWAVKTAHFNLKK